jgi:hypothetical protein
LPPRSCSPARSSSFSNRSTNHRTDFVGVPDVNTLLLTFNASMGGNYQIASIIAPLLIPSIEFMLLMGAVFEGRCVGGGGAVKGPHYSNASLNSSRFGAAFSGLVA